MATPVDDDDDPIRLFGYEQDRVLKCSETTNTMVTPVDDDDDPIRLFGYEQDRVLKYSEITSFTIEDYGLIEEDYIQPEGNQPVYQNGVSGDIESLKEYNDSIKEAHCEIASIGGKATYLQDPNINETEKTAFNDKVIKEQIETVKMAKRPYIQKTETALPSSIVNFKKNLGLTGMKILKKDIIVDDVPDENLCETRRGMKRKAYDSKTIEENSGIDVCERIIGKAYENVLKHVNCNVTSETNVLEVDAGINSNDVDHQFLSKSHEYLEVANMHNLKDTKIPKKVCRSKSLQISSVQKLTEIKDINSKTHKIPTKINMTDSKISDDNYLRNSKSMKSIIRTQNLNTNSRERNEHTIVKKKCTAVFNQTKKNKEDITGSSSIKKNKLNEVTQNYADKICHVEPTVSNLSVSKKALCISKKRRNTISSSCREDMFTTSLKVCEKNIYGVDAIIPHYHKCSSINKMGNIKENKTERGKSELLHNPLQANSEKTLGKTKWSNNICKIQKDRNVKTQYVSLSNLSSIMVPINEKNHEYDVNTRPLSQTNVKNNIFNSPITYSNISAPKTHQLPIALQEKSVIHKTPTIIAENINKPHTDDINSQSISQTPKVTVSLNENRGVIEPVKFSNSSRNMKPILENDSRINENVSSAVNNDALNTTQKIREGKCDTISNESSPVSLSNPCLNQRCHNPPMIPIQSTVSNHPSQFKYYGILMPRIPRSSPPKSLRQHQERACNFSHRYKQYPILNRLRTGVFHRYPCRPLSRPTINYVGHPQYSVISPNNLNRNYASAIHTSDKNNNETNVGSLKKHTDECLDEVKKPSSVQSSNGTNAKKFPMTEYSPPIKPILSYSRIIDILMSTDYDYPLLKKHVTLPSMTWSEPYHQPVSQNRNNKSDIKKVKKISLTEYKRRSSQNGDANKQNDCDPVDYDSDATVIL